MLVLANAELHAIERIEGFSAELELEPLVDLGVLEQGHVEIVDAGAAQIRHHARRIAERERGVEREDGSVEVAQQPVLHRSGQGGILTLQFGRPVPAKLPLLFPPVT